MGALQSIKAFILRQYLPLAFLVAFIVAMAWPAPGKAVLKPAVRDVHIVTFVNICTVFFISGLTLRTNELRAAFRRTAITGTIFGLVSIVGITPLLGFAVRLLLLRPAEYVAGLTIFCVVPTTLGVGVSLAQSAKGNVGLAIFLTVASNVIGVIFVPLWLKVMLSAGTSGIRDLNINIADIFVKLLISNLAPTVAGKLVRDCVPGVAPWVTRHRTELSIINNTSLAFIIWQTLSSARDLIIDSTFGTMLLVFLAALLIHCIYLAFNSAAVAAMRIPAAEAVSTIIMASQKSAPVAVTAIAYITPDPVVQGLLSVPAVTGQLLQIFVGQPLAHYMEGRVEAAQAAAAAKLLPPDSSHCGGNGGGGGDGNRGSRLAGGGDDGDRIVIDAGALQRPLEYDAAASKSPPLPAAAAAAAGGGRR